MSNEYPTALHRWFDEVWNQHRVETINEMITERTQHHGLNGPNGPPVSGVSEFMGFRQRLLDAFPNLSIEVHDVVREGNKYGALFTLRGTHTGSWLGRGPTGKDFSCYGSGICTMEGDKFVEVWNVLDFAKLEFDLFQADKPVGQYPTLLHRWFEEVWNQKRTDTIHELLTNKTIHHDLNGPGSGEIVGIEPYLVFHAGFLAAFPDLHVEVRKVEADDDKLTGHFTVTGTQAGPLGEIPATGKKVRFDGKGICVFTDGKCAEVWNEIDFGKMQYDLDPNTPDVA